jgi:hypothetical protein
MCPVDIGTVAAQLLSWEYLYRIFGIGSLQCADFVEPTLQRNLNLCIPGKGIARPQYLFPHSCVCERSIYSHVRSTYFPAAE